MTKVDPQQTSQNSTNNNHRMSTDGSSVTPSSSILRSTPRSSIPQSVYVCGDPTSNHGQVSDWWNERSLIDQAFDMGGYIDTVDGDINDDNDNGDYDHPVHTVHNNDGSLMSFTNAKASVLHLHKLTINTVMTPFLMARIHAREWVNSKLVVAECVDTAGLEKVLDLGGTLFRNIVVADVRLEGTGLVKALIRAMMVDPSSSSSSTNSPCGLERLELREMRLSYIHAAILAKGLAASQSLKELYLGTVTFDDPRAVRVLSAGLRANKSIEKLSLVRCQLHDKNIVILSHALGHHPTLKELDLSGNHCRKLGLRGLSQLLSMDDCLLRVLKLNDQYYKMMMDELKERLHVDELLDALPRNSSLRNLELCRNELIEVDGLLAILWKCPNLKALSLLGNRIDDIKTWRKFWSQTRPSRLQKLELSYNPFHFQYGRHLIADQSFKSALATTRREEHALLFAKLLENHPELYYAGTTASTYQDTCHQAKIQHYLDLNKTGRVLVANNNIPLSVWPAVIEKAGRQFEGEASQKARQANVIFHLLKGPLTCKGRANDTITNLTLMS